MTAFGGDITMFRIQRFSICALAFALASTFAAAQNYQKGPRPMTYRMAELGVPTSAPEVLAFDINDLGQSVGTVSASAAERNGFFRDHAGNVTFISTLSANSSNRKINAAGEVAGYVEDPVSGPHAFRWNSSSGSELLAFGETSQGFGINGFGDVVGSYRSHGQDHAFLWNRTGETIDLGTLENGTNAVAYAVNDARQVAGLTIDRNGVKRAFFISPGAKMQSLFPADQDSGAFAINNWGRAAGFVRTRNGVRAFIYDSRTNTSALYGSPSTVSVAYAIEYSGVAVGQSDGKAALFLSLKAFDLNTLVAGGTPWNLTSAYAINNKGQIAVVGTLNGVTRSFLLTPIE